MRKKKRKIKQNICFNSEKIANAINNSNFIVHNFFHTFSFYFCQKQKKRKKKENEKFNSNLNDKCELYCNFHCLFSLIINDNTSAILAFIRKIIILLHNAI